MPIINTFQISRYKQIPVSIAPGNIPDGGFSTFELNSKLGDRRGTSDFDGILLKLVLLGEVEKNTLNTGNVSLQQFNSMSDDEVEKNIQSGRFNRLAQRIGWVELGTSHPSFYYEDCVIGNKYGKRPKSDNYFDLLEMNVSPYLVNGDAVGIDALRRVNNWNAGETFGNWGIPPHQNQQRMSINEYLIIAINGGMMPQQYSNAGVTYIPRLLTTAISNIPLLAADYLEHFESANSQKFTLASSFSDIETDTVDAEKQVYGRLRRTIPNGFKPIGIVPRQFPELNNLSDLPLYENRSQQGECIALPNSVILDDKTTGTFKLSYFTNQSSFSTDYSHTYSNELSKESLYNTGLKIDELPVAQVLNSVYSPSNSAFTSTDIGSIKYFQPTDILPEILPDGIVPDSPIAISPESTTIDRNRFTTKDFVYSKTAKESGTITQQNMFRPKDVSKWKQEKSLNLDSNPHEQFLKTYLVYKKPSTEMFQLKKRIVNSGMRIDEYKNSLILIKEDLNKKKRP